MELYGLHPTDVLYAQTALLAINREHRVSAGAQACLLRGAGPDTLLQLTHPGRAPRSAALNQIKVWE
ncbi:hypothetical protein SKAU_G00405760 [Synaphobranchus kaupii]|uniref:Uncharacterized protein n=1 Tax=Synaphobranchus kaupii TaxID=118154 RepID=A0A9Q1ICU9_SYNKA|nr:hypothetical protein SKAU_G00405760 [Synaphobranchus kaupii]